LHVKPSPGWRGVGYQPMPVDGYQSAVGMVAAGRHRRVIKMSFEPRKSQKALHKKPSIFSLASGVKIRGSSVSSNLILGRAFLSVFRSEEHLKFLLERLGHAKRGELGPQGYDQGLLERESAEARLADFQMLDDDRALFLGQLVIEVFV
jgi:hypothetical protein